MKKLLAAGLGLVVLGACSGSPSRPSPSTSGPVETATPAPVTTLEDLVPGLDGTETAPPASPLAAAKPLTLAVAGTAGTGAWQASTVGLSFESSDLADPRWEPENSDLALLLDALGHPSLRFGGNSADRRVWWTSSNEPAPTWATVTVTPADLQRVARMAHTTRSTVTLVLDLGHHDPARAADMAAHARKAFGKSLLAVTIGNEPNGFALASQPQLKLRPATWGVADYIAQATTYAQKIHATTPGLPIAGPGAYDAPWWRAFAESGITPKAALTQHWYPLWSCAGRTDGDPLSSPTVANLLSARTHQRAVTTMTMAKQVAATHDLPLWMEETGPTSCSGSAISGTPAQALWSEDLIKMRHSMTGQRFDGCPTWHPTRLADGTPMREKFNEADYPFLMTSYKSNLMSSMAIAVERLRQVHPHNPISINREDAARLGIGNGQKIRVTSPGGSITGVAIVRDGVMKGAIAIEHGYGHWELGARSHQIDGKATVANPALTTGVLLNNLGFADPSRGGHVNTWVETVSGAVVRQGLPVRVERA